ncbi:MAG: hypothetical protein RMK15_01675 [Chloroflexota bacterium]|nr:hypothetical protein [Dehalococcoidia bacterium]MDW8045975.1 hypothetical protein [Chloroflexota bacterium]
MVRTVAAALLAALALAALPPRAQAQTWPETCGAYGPFDFDAYEALDSRATYNAAIALAAEGRFFSGPFQTPAAETVDFSYPGLESGPRGDRRPPALSLRVPPAIMRSIVWIESEYQMASSSVPWGGVGPALRSYDCGYGLGQVTSGMANSAGTPTAKQALAGTHFVFNLAESVRILASKWNAAPEYRPVAGTGDPAALEDWYFAIWSYNGFAWSNHPLNPERDRWRGEVYHCGNPNAPGYGWFDYGDYTYPERVYGCMRYPPTRGGQPMWGPVTFQMPRFDAPDVAAAFSPDAWLECALYLRCAGMDFPTTIPELGVAPHPDPSPPADPAGAAVLLGAPRLAVEGPAAAVLQTRPNGDSDSVTVTVRNTGTWIAPFRVRTSAPWIRVRHPGDPVTRTLDGGVAVGTETRVVVTANQTTAGYVSVLLIDVDRSRQPEGVATGAVWIEPLFGQGAPARIDITAVKSGDASSQRIVIPGLAR